MSAKLHQHDKHIRHIVKIEMEQKLKGLKDKQTELNEKLSHGFDYNTFRELSIINHRIEVSELRREGGWLKSDFPEITAVTSQHS